MYYHDDVSLLKMTYWSLKPDIFLKQKNHKYLLFIFSNPHHQLPKPKFQKKSLTKKHFPKKSDLQKELLFKKYLKENCFIF